MRRDHTILEQLNVVQLIILMIIGISASRLWQSEPMHASGSTHSGMIQAGSSGPVFSVRLASLAEPRTETDRTHLSDISSQADITLGCTLHIFRHRPALPGALQP